MNPFDWLAEQKFVVEWWLYQHQAQLDAVYQFIAERKYVLMMLAALGYLWAIRKAKRHGRL